MMQNFYLNLNHWQIFLLLTIPLAISFEGTFGQVVKLLWFYIYIGWIYSIATASSNRIPGNVKIRSGYFNSCIIFLLVYFTVLVALNIPGKVFLHQKNHGEFSTMALLILPLHLYSVWCLLYIFYFAAKMLRSVVEGELVAFNNSFGYFISFWIFPIGVWFIQPKANKLN